MNDVVIKGKTKPGIFKRENILHLVLAIIGSIFVLTASVPAGQVMNQTGNHLPNLLWEISADQVKSRVQKQTDAQVWLPFIQHDITSHRISYKTKFQGKPITVSGAITLPRDSAKPRPILVYCHGTTFDEKNIPSRWDSFMGEALPALNGFITLMPDYIGYGESEDEVHPYMIQEPTVTTIIDLVQSGKKILDRYQIKYDSRIFLWGFSQGGHATLSVLKEIEEQDKPGIKITAAASVGGPYKLKENIDFILKHDNFEHIGYIGFIFASYNQIYWKRPYTDFFQEPYARLVEQYTNKKISLREMREGLTPQVKNLMNPEFLENYLGNGEKKIKAAFQANSDFNWIPKTPTVIYHGSKDQDVPFELAKSTYERFIKAGADPGKIMFISIEGVNHNTSGTLAFSRLLDFFNSFIDK